MSNRRKLIVGLGQAYLLGPFAVLAQPQEKVWRIGFLGVQTAAGYGQQLDAFRGGLQELGYIEGKNIVVVYRWAGGANERLAQLAADLLREKVDILVTHARQGTRAAQRATASVPIVFAGLAGDPVAEGFAKSLARPGGNITGSVSLSRSFAAKQMELVKDTLPHARKVAFMVSPTAARETIDGMEAAAKTLKLDLQLMRVSGANALEAVINRIAETHVDALIVQNSTLLIPYEGRIAELASRRRIPTLGNVQFAHSGGLMGYGADRLSSFRRAAYFVDRIVKGAKPADLPIEQPTTIELVINMKTARTLGITIPPLVAVRANQVIE